MHILADCQNYMCFLCLRSFSFLLFYFIFAFWILPFGFAFGVLFHGSPMHRYQAGQSEKSLFSFSLHEVCPFFISLIRSACTEERKHWLETWVRSNGRELLPQSSCSPLHTFVSWSNGVSVNPWKKIASARARNKTFCERTHAMMKQPARADECAVYSARYVCINFPFFLVYLGLLQRETCTAIGQAH